MLNVVFYNSQNMEKVENFRSLDFKDAVALSEQVEKECRIDKEKFNAEFQVTGLDGFVYYKGIFGFGSYDYQNIYHQVLETAPKIKVTKDKERERQFLLEQIEVLTPAAYKEVEVVDKTFINLEKTNISKLKKWQRLIFYVATPIGLLGCLFLFAQNIMLEDKFQTELANEVEKGEIHVALIEQYEQALQGNRVNLIPYLEGLQVVNKLNENQTVLLINEYLLNGQFEKAVALNDDLIYVETLILSNKLLSDAEKIKLISDFNELYPTNEARFDLAYFEGNYELLLNIENVNMTVQRSEMKTYAYLKLDRIEDAKRELNNNTNAALEEKIIRYEVLAAEIKTLENRLTYISEAETAELQVQIDAKKNEIKAL